MLCVVLLGNTELIRRTDNRYDRIAISSSQPAYRIQMTRLHPAGGFAPSGRLACGHVSE